MAGRQAGRARQVASILLMAGTAIVGFFLLAPAFPFSDPFTRGSYDFLHSLGSHGVPGNSPVIIVYLDRASYQIMGRDPLRRWPRELHAQLVRRLARAGAKAVVFDIIFDSPGEDGGADEEFTAALRESGRVVLAEEHNEKVTHRADADGAWTRTAMFRHPFRPFEQAAAGVGVATLSIDDDLEVRRFLAGFPESGKPSLVWATGEFLRLEVAQGNEMEKANEQWIRYYGPALALPHVSFSEAVDPVGVPDEYFRGKIVLIGARPMEGRTNERRDEFRSPFHSWSNKEYFMPGVEVHATEILNLMRGDGLRRLSGAGEAGVLLAVAGLFGAGLVWLRPAAATGAAVAGAGVALGLASVGFARGVWFPWLIVSGAQIPTALFGSVLFHSVEWYRTRRRYEARIHEQAALIDKAHDAIVVQSIRGEIVYINPSAERLYGWTVQELQGSRATEELFSLDLEKIKEARAAAMREGEWNGELRLQTKSGGTVIVASRWTLIRDQKGEPRDLLLMNSDITAQKNLEQEFLRTQRMNTIGTLAGGMAHDLNNALAPILMGAQLLRRKTADAETRETLAMMEASTHRGAEMVRQVLLFARGRGGEFERVNVRGLVNEVEKMIVETFPRNILVETFLPADLWNVTANPTQLHQVLLNLSVNARDAMPQGGKLSFVADNVDLNEGEAVSIAGGRAGEFVSILVSDTGQGMTPEVREKIFEPFFSTKGAGLGTGIGLSTVVRIVKAHGGFMRVESEVGQGSSFEVFWPRAVEAKPKEKIPKQTELARGHGEIILLVDDEKALRDLVTAELMTFGYRVIAAESAEEGSALLLKHAGKVRVVITDSPIRDNLPPDLPRILTSGGRSAVKDPRAPILSKPFTLDELLAAIAQSLGSGRLD